MALTKIGTDSIKDDAVTLAKQAAGTDGQIITYDASGNPVAVGPGTDGQVLTSTGAGSPPAFETISTTSGSATPRRTGDATVAQAIATGLTPTGSTADVVLGTVANLTDSSIYAIGIKKIVVHGASSTNHGYLGGWVYQTGKTYDIDGVYVQSYYYNQYLINTDKFFIIPWDPSGTQSVSIKYASTLNNGTGNTFSFHVWTKLENV